MLEVPTRRNSAGGVGEPPTPSAAAPPTPHSARIGAATGEPFDTVAVLDIDAFNARLEHLRDLYQLFSTEGNAVLEFGRGIDDPWRTADQPSDQLSWIDARDVSPKANDDREANMADITEIQLRHKHEMEAKDAEIMRMKTELDMMRSAFGADARSTVPGTIYECPEEAGPKSGQAMQQIEQAVAVEFASKFLSSLREMKQDLQSQSEAIQSIRWEVGKVGGTSATR